MTISTNLDWPRLTGTDRCPCLSGQPYGECCEPFHRGTSSAPTAERLMRSRYSAFVVGDAAYLLRTHHPSTRPATLDLDPSIRWYRLDILGRTRGGVLDTDGEVEFRASYRFDGEAGSQHERSTFTRDRGTWSYVSGV